MVSLTVESVFRGIEAVLGLRYIEYQSQFALEDSITFVDRKLLRGFVVTLMAILSVFLILNNIRSYIRGMLEEETLVIQGRLASARSYVEASVAPVDMIAKHMAASLQLLNDGYKLLPEIDLQVDDDSEIYAIVSEKGDWNAQGMIPADDFTDPLHEDLSAGIEMADMFASIISSRPDTAWAYYLSSNGFLLISPQFPTLSFDDFTYMYSLPFWRDAFPASNSEGKMIVTEVYEDLGGKGLMVTFSKPVSVDGRFYGVVCMDLTIEQLNRALSTGKSIGHSIITDENGAALNALPESPAERSLLHVLMKEDRDTQGELLKMDKGYVFNADVLPGELRFHHHVSSADLVAEAIWNSILFIVVILALNVLVFLSMRLRRSYKVIKEESEFSQRLLSIVGHDLQTPISVARQAAELMVESTSSEAAEMVRKSSISALAMLRDLSLWGKSRFGEVPIRPEVCDAQVVFIKAVESVQSAADIKDIKIEYSSEVSLINVDSDALVVVIRNLASNAVKFSRPGSSVALKAVAGPAGYALLKVIDQGDGMDEGQIEDLMNRKQLQSRPGTRGEKGSGIGLNLVTSLCDRAGWPIAFHSVSGTGTEITISVPLAE